MSADEISLTVHHFACNSASTSLYTSQSSVLEQGKALLLQVKGETRQWHSPQPPQPRQENRKFVHFVYALPPPRVEGARLIKLKDWGTPVEMNEIFRVAGLPEFSSTNFATGSTTPTSGLSSPALEGLPSKKRKLNNKSIYQLIPQPHFLPSPIRTSNKQIKLPPFKKSNPVFILPFSSSSLPEFAEEWDRCAWLIPISGSFPWAEATSGRLLNSYHGNPSSPSTQLNAIIWTPEAVLEFWNFLREIRAAGHLGPIGLSFHTGTTTSSQPATEKLIRTSSKTLPTHAYLQTNATNTSTSTSFVSVSAVDHIKIYHDGSIYSKLRAVLDAWKFDNIRLLLGAKFVLLDDNSRGIMIL